MIIKPIYRFIVLLCIFFSSGSVIAINGFNVSTPIADGLLVKFKAATSKSSQLHALTASGLREVNRFELVPGLAHVKEVAGETLVGTLSSIQSDPNVEYVEPNYYVKILKTPNDPKYINQYGLSNTGQLNGTVGADISAEFAWDIETGTDVVVAVIDTGVDYFHSDLRGNIWINPGEIAGNGIDDDANGFIDDVYGWDFSNSDNDPMDDMGHGTHVAGIIAAKGNNGIGQSGVNWDAKIMALKFIDGKGVGTTSNAIKAINYAVAMGVKVSNNSWGGGGYSQALYETILAAQKAEHLFVAAAGNTSKNTDDPANSMHYPSSYVLDNVISVAATDEFDKLGTFSNYGSVSVDLAAPGRQIQSLWLNNSYIELDGTSMAAPYVAGAAALLWAKDPTLTIRDVRRVLLSTVDTLPSLSGLMVTGGRLNLHKALSSISVMIYVSPLEQHITLNDSLTFNANGGQAPYVWSVTNPSVAQINTNTGLLSSLTTGVTRVIATDQQGFVGSSRDISIDKLLLVPQTGVLMVGEQLQFTVSGGVPPYIWQVSNNRVASIDSVTGLLFAKASGQVTINVTDANNIRVESGAVEINFISTLGLSPSTVALSVGETLSFSGNGGITPYRWLSENINVIAINEISGLLTTKGPGVSRISLTDSSGVKIFSGDITVNGIVIKPQSYTMNIGDTQFLTVIGGVAPFEWRVSNSLVASINNTGKLTALSPGSIKITLMDSNGVVVSTDTILVTNNTALSMNIPNSILTPLQVLTINITGGIQPYDIRSSNPAVINVNAINNVATAIGDGVAYITVYDSIGSTVSSGVLEVREISLTPQNKSLTLGEKLQFFATGGVAPLSWRVSNNNIANISNTGLLTSVAMGNITVEVIDADGIRAKTSGIKVMMGVVANRFFTVSPNSATLSKRSSGVITFIASGGVEPYVFSLSNAVGTIDRATGKYSPKSDVPGRTTIIVTDADGFKIETGNITVR